MTVVQNIYALLNGVGIYKNFIAEQVSNLEVLKEQKQAAAQQQQGDNNKQEYDVIEKEDKWEPDTSNQHIVYQC